MKNRIPVTLLAAAIGGIFATTAHAEVRSEMAQELAAKRAALEAERNAPVLAKRSYAKDLEVILGDTTGGPLWNRPSSGGFFGLAGGGVNYAYAVYPFFVSANDNCDISLTENGDPAYDTYLFLYANGFDPNQPLVNGVNGDDDSGPGLNSLLAAEPLSTGTQYYAVATGWSTGDFGPFNLSINCPVADVTVAQGVVLDNPASNSPVLVAEELIIPPNRTLTNTGRLNVLTNLDYSFSPGEVRYARLHCPGVTFAAGSTVTYSGDPSNLIGAVNNAADGAIYFSITAGATPAVAADLLIVDGDRIVTAEQAIDCTYGLYDFPSQAQVGGTPGRVASTSGAYIRFAPSYGLVVDSQGNPVADVESSDPAYSEFEFAAPTFDVMRGQIGGFSYGTAGQLGLSAQPITLDGAPIELADLMGANTALVFAGDFEAAADVYFSPFDDCSFNIQSADSFDDTSAVFVMGNSPAMNHYLCYETSGVAIRASAFTVALDAVSAAAAVYAVADRGPLALGEITRNGTELQAPLAQLPAGWLSRMVLTNTGSLERAYEITVFGETGNTISTSNLSGTIAAQSTKVVDLETVLTGFTGAPRATLNVTVAAPNNTIQGMYQIVNPDSGSISNHVMVRPGSN